MGAPRHLLASAQPSPTSRHGARAPLRKNPCVYAAFSSRRTVGLRTLSSRSGTTSGHGTRCKGMSTRSSLPLFCRSLLLPKKSLLRKSFSGALYKTPFQWGRPGTFSLPLNLPLLRAMALVRRFGKIPAYTRLFPRVGRLDFGLCPRAAVPRRDTAPVAKG